MMVFGLLLILTAAGAVAFAVMAPSAALQTIELSALGITVSASPLGMFVAGALSVVLVGLGSALINRGARSKASSRRELRELRKGQSEAAAQVSTDAGRHSSSRDRPQKDSDTDMGTAAGTSKGTTTPGGGASAGSSTPTGNSADTGTTADTGTDPGKQGGTDRGTQSGTDSSH